MILLTTSRRPTKRVRTFIKELERVIPNSLKKPRGKASLRSLREYMILNGFDKLMIVDNHKGNPRRIHFYKLEEGMLRRVALIYLKSTSMQINSKELFVASKLSLELDESCFHEEEARKLLNFLREFLQEEVLVNKREGGELILKVSRINRDFFIYFLDPIAKRVIRPNLRVEKIVWMTQGG